MTIQQTIDIPASRNVHFDVKLPAALPKGRAQVTLNFTPLTGEAEEQSGEASPFPCRPMSPELVTVMKEAEDRAQRERADPAYRAELAEIRRKCQEGVPLFGSAGIDDMEFHFD